MTESQYEKYVVRKPIPPDLSINWGRADLGIILPYFFLKPEGPLKEANTLLEYVWITEDCAFGVTEEKPPHKHNCEEIFLFLGTNPKDSDDLGAEVEFWLGEGEATEKIKCDTSAVIFIPKDLLHLPFFCRNVRKPLLHMVIGLNIGEMLKDTRKYPLRGV
jgi:hypothetical protein